MIHECCRCVSERARFDEMWFDCESPLRYELEVIPVKYEHDNHFMFARCDSKDNALMNEQHHGDKHH